MSDCLSNFSFSDRQLVSDKTFALSTINAVRVFSLAQRPTPASWAMVAPRHWVALDGPLSVAVPMTLQS